MTDTEIRRGSARVVLACRALSAAANDLHVAARRDGVHIDGVAHAVEVEAARVCELSEKLAKLAEDLARSSSIGAAPRSGRRTATTATA